jgi:hypothetical protein
VSIKLVAPHADLDNGIVIFGPPWVLVSRRSNATFVAVADGSDHSCPFRFPRSSNFRKMERLAARAMLTGWGPGGKGLRSPPASLRRLFIVVVGFLDFDFFVLLLDLFFVFDRGLDHRGFRS